MNLQLELKVVTRTVTEYSNGAEIYHVYQKKLILLKITHLFLFQINS